MLDVRCFPFPTNFAMDTSRYIAKHVINLPKSGIRDFFEIVSKMKDVISLGIGEPDFDTPWHIREAGIYALEKGKTHYTSNLGLIELRRAISKYVEKNYSVSYVPDNEVIITVGVSEGLDLACRALINPGDKVMYHQPCYVSYSWSRFRFFGKIFLIGCNIFNPTLFVRSMKNNSHALKKLCAAS